jgi:hypothetical protein
MRTSLLGLSLIACLTACEMGDEFEPEIGEEEIGEEELGVEELGVEELESIPCPSGWDRHRVNQDQASVRGISPCDGINHVAYIPRGTLVCHAHQGWITCPSGTRWASTYVDGWGSNGPWQVRVGALTSH